MKVEELVDIFQIHPRLTTRVFVHANHKPKDYVNCGHSVTYADFLIIIDKRQEFNNLEVRSIRYEETDSGNDVYLSIDLGNIGDLAEFF